MSNKVFSNGEYWFVAESAEDADRRLRAHEPQPDEAHEPMKAVSDDESLTIHNYADDGLAVTKTAGEWAATEPAGVLASVNW